MGLRGLLTRWAVRRPHVLVVECPGWFTTRVAVEVAVLERGWVLAQSSADADVLLVAGVPGAALGERIDLVHDQLPGPRARVAAGSPEGVADALDLAVRLLADDPAQRRDAAERTGYVPPDHGDMDHGDHGDMDHGDHGDMEMSPQGIPLAGGAEDRDGLEMDVLEVRLGPVLRHWPAGLVLRCTLAGDVVTDATAELLTGPPAPVAEDATVAAARSLDSAADVFALAGDHRGRRTAVALRDACLDVGGAGQQLPDDLATRISRAADRCAASRTLRWVWSGLDVQDRVVALIRDAAEALTAPTRGSGSPDAEAAATRIADSVVGYDLAVARLLVAAAGPLPGVPGPAGEASR